MSTQALEEALDWLENNPTGDGAQDARRRARSELEAIRKAARILRGVEDEDGASERAFRLLDTIAKKERHGR